MRRNRPSTSRLSCNKTALGHGFKRLTHVWDVQILHLGANACMALLDTGQIPTFQVAVVAL